MEFDQMESLIIAHLPLSSEDIGRIEEMLRAENVFCTSFPSEDEYSVVLYHQQFGMHDTETRMLMDQNIFSRVVGLAKGGAASQNHLIPAAVMAFAQCSNIQIDPSLALTEIDPSLALTEKVARQQYDDAAQDLAFFRAADNLHPSEFADIAVGRASALRTQLNAKPDGTDLRGLTRRLKQYSRVYLLS